MKRSLRSLRSLPRTVAENVPGLAQAYHVAARQVAYAKYNLRDVYDSYLSRPRRPALTPFGFRFGGSASQHHRAMQAGTFEPHEVRLLARLMRDADLFVDVGANVGYYTCLARSLGKPAIAIEPMAGNLRYLFENLAANNWEDTEVWPVGVSERIGIATLFGASSTGASLIDNWAGAPSILKRNIAVSTLDTLLGGRFLDRRLLLKVDVEGHEYGALRGATELLDRAIKPVWFMELTLHEYHPGGANPHFEDSFTLLWRHGYTSYLLDGERLLEVTAADVARWQHQGRSDSTAINYLFLPPGQSAPSASELNA